MKTLPRLSVLLILATFCALPPCPTVAAQEKASKQAKIITPDRATPILKVDELRPGMKGYGLTVFHGTKIEPFPIEVVSVESLNTPGRAVIWIRCDHPTLNVSGPVQGMSGSPIFVWPDGRDHEIGQGGRLIGAFAFGFGGVLECYAGVQPIELMREVGERMDVKGERPVASATDRQRYVDAAATMLEALERASGDDAAGRLANAKAEAMRRLLGLDESRDTSGNAAKSKLPAGPRGIDGQVRRLMVPVSMGSADMAELMRPIMEPMGFSPVAAVGGGSKAPVFIDPATTTIQPGSVLAIPFATGDLDLSGSGTVTDVLPDGRVLAFGHAMDGIGDRALPMYTGYVHYVVPLRSISFKLSGSLAPAGSVIRDEQSAVGGLSETRYGTAPVKVRVKLPNQDEQVYKYQVLEDQPITPGIMAAVVGQSVGAVQQLPRENTLRMKGKLRFEGSREIELDVIQARATSQAVAASVAPVGAALMNNPFERIKLESAEIEVEVEPKSRIASISDIWIDRTQVAPGESVGINVEFRRLRGETFIKRIEFEIPEDADEGDYQLTIGDAATYVQRLTGTHPHYSRARNVDQLARAIQRLNAFRSDAVYLMLTMPETTGLAVGTQELPDLPSSRVALLTGQAGSRVTPYADLEEKIVPMDDVISGSLEMVINVRDPYATTPKADAAE